MKKESIWDSSAVKALSTLATVLTIITFLLEFGKDLWLPLSSLLPSQSSIYAFLVTIVVFIVLLYVLARARQLGKTKAIGKNILDLAFARTIALECGTPKTAGHLRQLYEAWIRIDAHISVLSFNDYIEKMEKQDCLTFNKREKTWRVTKKAVDYILKYHGGD